MRRKIIQALIDGDTSYSALNTENYRFKRLKPNPLNPGGDGSS
jgi:hypothetical protein